MAEVTPELVLRAYAAGVFPMAEGRKDRRLFWVDPDRRGIIPLDRFHLPRSLRKTVAAGRFTITIDRSFMEVIEACAAPRPDRKGTWINDQIVDLFGQLHRMGFAHSVEARLGDRLVGGLYGLSLGAVFFGESMFSRETDASKVALVHLVARLIRGGYHLLDTQFVTDHLRRFGAVEIERKRYHTLLEAALEHQADFYSFGDSPSPAEVLQSITQTS